MLILNDEMIINTFELFECQMVLGEFNRKHYEKLIINHCGKNHHPTNEYIMLFLGFCGAIWSINNSNDEIPYHELKNQIWRKIRGLNDKIKLQQVLDELDKG